MRSVAGPRLPGRVSFIAFHHVMNIGRQRPAVQSLEPENCPYGQNSAGDLNRSQRSGWIGDVRQVVEGVALDSGADERGGRLDVEAGDVVHAGDPAG